MCRIFGCVATEPVSLRHELLDAPNPLIRQSDHHDSGWDMAVYGRAEGSDPTLIRIPEEAHAGRDLARATEARGRIFNATLPFGPLRAVRPFWASRPGPLMPPRRR